MKPALRTPAAERVYVSSSALAAKTVPAVVDECERLGIRGVEFTSSLPYHDETVHQLEEARRGGLRILLHNYFPVPRQPFVINLASEDSSVLSRSMEHCRAALQLSAALGAPFYSVHAGFVTDPQVSELGSAFEGATGRRMEDAVATFHESVALLCEAAESLGVDLLIENNVVAPANAPDRRNRIFLGVTPDDFDALAAVVPSRRLGVLLDVAHLKVSARSLGMDAPQALSRFVPRVRALHLSDNDGFVDNNQGFTAEAWFVPHLSRFTEALFSIETRPLPDHALHACMTLVEDAT